MPDDPAKRFAGGPEAKLFEIGHKDFKGINTQVPRDSIADEEFSWLENMQPIGKSLFSLNDAGTAVYSGGTASNPIVYFYMFDSSRDFDGNYLPVAQYVFIAFEAGNAVAINAQSGVVTATFTATGSFFPGDPAHGGSLPQATQFNNGGIAIVSDSTANGLFACDGLAFYPFDVQPPAWFNAGTTAAVPSGINGVATGVWQSRLWIAKGVGYISSVPGDATDYTIADGATDQQSNDPFIHSAFLSLAQANGFLYIFGDSSVNVISNIQSSGSPTVTTTFNNQNVDPQLGTPWQNTVQAYGRGLIYANPSGVYALFGGAAQKVSDQLDGIFDAEGNFLNTTLESAPSSAVAMLNNQRCYMLLVPLTGPFDSSPRNALVVWDGKKWFIASQTPNLRFIATQMISSFPSAWGTDGTSLYKLFAAAGSSKSKIWQTKLFNGSGMQITKASYRMFSRFIDTSGMGVAESATVDSQLLFGNPEEQAFTQTSISPNPVIWINAASGVVQFQNASLQNVEWSPSLGSVIIGTGIDINSRGNIIGWTSTSTSNSFIMTEEMMIYQEQSPIGG